MEAKPNIQIEKWETFQPDFMAMSRQHWSEVALNRDRIKLNVNWDYYLYLSEAGMLRCMAIRLDGKLIGYHVGFVLENPHYKGYKIGQTDVYFILPEYRKSLLGMQLFMEVEDDFRQLKCVKMVTVTKAHMDIGTILNRLDWDLVEHTYTKELI